MQHTRRQKIHYRPKPKPEQKTAQPEASLEEETKVPAENDTLCDPARDAEWAEQLKRFEKETNSMSYCHQYYLVYGINNHCEHCSYCIETSHERKEKRLRYSIADSLFLHYRNKNYEFIYRTIKLLRSYGYPVKKLSYEFFIHNGHLHGMPFDLFMGCVNQGLDTQPISKYLRIHQDYADIDPKVLKFLLDHGAICPASSDWSRVIIDNNLALLKVIIYRIPIRPTWFLMASVEAKVICMKYCPGTLEVDKSSQIYQRAIEEYHTHMYILTQNCVLLHAITIQDPMFDQMNILEIMQYTSQAALTPLSLDE